ncbi:MAG: hypothetical protein RL508_394 [Actinomycetota bacterium]|jgi:signal transduction histidine kinase
MVLASLRARVIATALAAVAVSSVLILATLALMIGPTARASQDRELHLILNKAIALEGKVRVDQLADRLSRPGYSVVITSKGKNYVPTKSGNYVISSSDYDSKYLTVQASLPVTGVTVTVATLSFDTYGVLGQLLSIGVPTLIGVMLILGLAIALAMRVALRPLDDMTTLATQIAEGELGGRLEVTDPNTELGRTAVAFDKMLDALEESLHRAQAAEARLRQLCADVAHELRSPISSMVAAADNLMREISLGGRKPAAIRNLAEETSMAVVRDGRRASRIVGDLTLAAQLDVAELAQHEVLPVRLEASELLRETVANAQLHSDFEILLTNGAGETFVNADPDRLQQIINNLLSNASHWAESKILISAARDGKFWVLRVTDDGPGVPADQRENIFGRFVRLDTNRARSRGGSGLGLAISQALATAQGGSLRCLENDSVIGGAVFELRLPAVK